MLFSRLWIFLKISKKSFRYTISVSLDPDQAWHFVGLIWNQTVCKGYQQRTKVATSVERVKCQAKPNLDEAFFSCAKSMFIFFLFAHETIHSGYSLEVSFKSAFDEYEQFVFSWTGNKILTLILLLSGAMFFFFFEENTLFKDIHDLFHATFVLAVSSCLFFCSFTVSATATNQNMAVCLWLDIFMLVASGPCYRSNSRTRKAISLLVNKYYPVILFGGGDLMWQRCCVSYVTRAANWYWLTVGQGLLSL